MTTPFLESPRFPDDLAFWAKGGVNYATVVVGSTSGREQRTSLWTFGRGAWDLQNTVRMPATAPNYTITTLRNFFRVAKGQAYGFRFRDWTDYQDEGNGILNTTGTGNGTATLQMYKNYVLAPLSDQRLIAKPQVGTIAIQRNGVAATAGGLPGQYSLDTTTGLVTWVADNSVGSSTWTPGTTTTFTVPSSVPSGWAVGKQLYFNSVVGTGAAVLNGNAFNITAISGLNVTVSANTNGLTVSSGIAYQYPSTSDTLTWTGNFDTPVRFDADEFAPQMGTDGLYLFQSLPIIEIRT